MNPLVEADMDRVFTLQSIADSVRIERDSARKLLLENKSRIINGVVRRYQIKHIGLDVYEVRLLPVGKKATVLVEVWRTEENGC